MKETGGIRTGKVSSIDYKTGMMKVVYYDKGKAVTSNFPYANFNNEYNMPPVGSQVLVAHLSNGSSRGVVLGNMWNEKNIPSESGKELYRKELSKTRGAAIIRYDDSSGEYLVKAGNIQINGINKTELDGPKVTIDASILVSIETPELKISIPAILLQGDKEEKIELTNKADINFLSEDKKIESKIKSVKQELIETFELLAKEDIVLQSDTNVNVTTKIDISLEDSTFKTTLSKVLERLEALDGDTSARK